jgi:hypothetical protein
LPASVRGRGEGRESRGEQRGDQEGGCALTSGFKGPRERAAGAEAGLRVGAVDPDDWAVLQSIHLARGHKLIHADTLDHPVLLINNHHDGHGAREGRALDGELEHELGEQGRVTQAVGRPTPVQLVTLDGQLERVTLPILRVGRHHVQVGADEPNRRSRRRGGRRTLVRDDDVAATLGERHTLYGERPALARVWRQRCKHKVGCIVLAWDQVLRRVVLQGFGDTDKLREQGLVTIRIELDYGQRSLCGLRAAHLCVCRARPPTQLACPRRVFTVRRKWCDGSESMRRGLEALPLGVRARARVAWEACVCMCVCVPECAVQGVPWVA